MKFTPASRKRTKRPASKVAKQHAPKAAFSDVARPATRPWRLPLKRDN